MKKLLSLALALCLLACSAVAFAEPVTMACVRWTETWGVDFT